MPARPRAIIENMIRERARLLGTKIEYFGAGSINDPYVLDDRKGACCVGDRRALNLKEPSEMLGTDGDVGYTTVEQPKGTGIRCG